MMGTRPVRLFPGGLRGFIFDCDGVMIDSRNANRKFYNLVLSALGLPPMRKDQEEYAFMATARQALLAMTPPEMHQQLEKICREKVDYEKDVMPLIRLKPGFRKFIEYAHSNGFRMAIDTNRTREGIQRILDFFSLPPYFEPVISASDSRPKPSSEGPEKICLFWKVKPMEVLFIGDSENDRIASTGCGMPFGAFDNADLEGEMAIRDFGSLRQWLADFHQANG